MAKTAATATAKNESWVPPVMPDRFKKIETDRFMYSPERCFGIPLVGWAIGKERMAPIQVGKNPDGSPIMREWSAIIIRATQPTRATNRDKELIEISEGQEVLIPCTYQLDNFLSAAAAHPARVFEIYINPKEQIDIGKGGQTMWTFDLGVSPESKTLAEFGMISKLTGKKLPQLPYNPETGEVIEEGNS